jgi:hypothetical protein
MTNKLSLGEGKMVKLKDFNFDFNFTDGLQVRAVGKVNGEDLNIDFPDEPDLENEHIKEFACVCNALSQSFRQLTKTDHDEFDELFRQLWHNKNAYNDLYALEKLVAGDQKILLCKAMNMLAKNISELSAEMDELKSKL